MLLSAPRTGDIDRLLHGAPAMLRSLSALSSKCGQRHVDSRRRRLNTDLLVRNELGSRPLTDRPEENDRKSSAYNVFSVHDVRFESNSDFGMTQVVNRRQFGHYYYAPAVGGISDTMIRPSVCPSLGYRHAGCLQLSHRRPPEMCELRPRTGRRSAAIFGTNCHRREQISSRRHRGDTLFVT